MGDVSIIIRKGETRVIDGDDEGGDDNDVDAISGSGESDLDNLTSPDPPINLTPTSNSSGGVNKISSSQESDSPSYLLPAIIGGVVLVVFIIVIVLVIMCRRRRRQRAASSKSPSKSVPVSYSGNGRQGGPQGGEGYSVAIPLTQAVDGEGPHNAPMEQAPPPPPPSSVPPKHPGLSISAGSTTSARYTPLGGRKGVSATPMPTTSKDNSGDDYNDKAGGSIYESIDDNLVENEYEKSVPAPPTSGGSRRPAQKNNHQRLSSVVDDPSMGSEEDKMLPPSSPV